MNTTTSEATPADRIARIAAAIGLAMEATFVPFSKSRHAKPAKGEKPWLSLNWSVTLQRDGQTILITDYAQGVGHAPAYKASVKTHGGANSILRERAYTIEIEQGRRAVSSFGDSFRPGELLPAPSLVDVLASLAMDASAIDYASFEQWAEEMGMNPDSRSGETTYRQCLSHALALRSALGEGHFSALRDAAADY